MTCRSSGEETRHGRDSETAPRGYMQAQHDFPSYPAPAAVAAGPASLACAPRGTNILQHVVRGHFGRFAAEYDSRYAKELGNLRLERIPRAATRFLTCGDYPLSGSGVYSRRRRCQGVARIRCADPECRHEYFRPFSCKGFFLCPSCSQKRTLLFAEYLHERLLLALPHRKFVFTIPKVLAPLDDEPFSRCAGLRVPAGARTPHCERSHGSRMFTYLRLPAEPDPRTFHR
jgi:hypothetical protein